MYLVLSAAYQPHELEGETVYWSKVDALAEAKRRTVKTIVYHIKPVAEVTPAYAVKEL